MRKPLWIDALQPYLKKVLLVAGLVMAAVAVLHMLPEPERPKRHKTQGAHAKQPCAPTLASRDMTLTGLARANKVKSITLERELEKVRQELKLARAETEALRDRKPRSASGSLTPEAVERMVKQQMQLQMQHLQAAQAPPPEPRPELPWQEVGPKVNPPTVDEPVPEPKYVKVPAGSVARAKLSDGLAWISDGTERYFSIEIQGMHTPNDGFIPLAKCYVIVKATLQIATEVVARLPVVGDRLSCVLPSGDTIEETFKGYITTGDDVQGLFAKVFSNDWDILKEFGKAAIPAALARAIDGTSTLAVSGLGTVTQESGSAVSRVGEEMARFYLENARVFARKVIWIDPKQDIYVYVREGFSLTGVTPDAFAHQGFNRRTFN
jgi:hypothetical protein